MRSIVWSYGVTTCAARLDDLLPRTLASLAAAGFDRPRLFVDGVSPLEWAARGDGLCQHEATVRSPALRTYGNWVLALAELYIREIKAHRYAVFQDDLVACRGLREYLERCQYPEKGYWNLYTFRDNEEVIAGKPDGWHVGAYLKNPKDPPRLQAGRGAVALVFDREAVQTLLTHHDIVERVADLKRGWRVVDGGVVNAMNKAGWTEWVHSPSLVQHTGLRSSMENKPHLLAQSFRGEDWNALELFKAKIG